MKKLHLFITAAMAVGLWGCSPDGPEYADDFDLVVTNYDKGANFSSKKTYSISDSIVKLFTADYSDPNGDTMPDFVDPSLASPVIARIDANMQSYGWTKVNFTQNPDVTLLASVMQTTTVYYYYDYYYWWWYYPYYWYYPYPITPSYATTKTGTLFVQMMSNVDRNSNGQAPVQWLGVFNGLMEGTDAAIGSRVGKSIDQAFKQSPYLKH